MAPNNTAPSIPVTPAESEFVPLSEARLLIRGSGRPPHRQTLLTLGLTGELDVRLIAGRFVVTRSSLDAYRERNRSAKRLASHQS